MVNGQAKMFCKNKFATWYSAEIQNQVSDGVMFEHASVDLKLSILKLIHVNWLVKMYNFFASMEGRDYILKGWEKAGIKSVVSETQILPPLDPFQDIYTN